MRCFLIIITLLLATPTFAAKPPPPSMFDGKRQGLVLGLGLGYVPAAGDIRKSVRGVKGLAFNFLVGHGWDESDLTVFEICASVYDCEVWTGCDAEPFSSQGLIGLSWYHYFGRGKSVPLTVAGIGWSGNDNEDTGLGFRAGVGYEFIRHFQITGNVFFGSSSDRLFTFSNTHMNILLTALAF